MHIVTECGCGKQFKAPQGLAGKRLKCPECDGRLVVPTLEQVAMQTALVDVKEQEKEWQVLRITALVGFGCLVLSGLVFPPMLLVCVLLVAIATIMTGIIGNTLLILHAFRNDDIKSGIVMALSFAIPFLWVYTLYYLVKKWDGTAAFQLTAWAFCGLGILLIVEVVFLLA